MPNGSLTIVGTGYRVAGQVTLEALAHVEQAQKLFYLVGDPALAQWLCERNPSAESLADCYAEGKPRTKTYREMVERILGQVRRGLDVTAAFYGHPGLFADPSHSALRIARREGYRAVLLPGISAEDCLFAELGIDPADHGCQSYEASDFLHRRPRFDPSCYLVLWQIGVIDEESIRETANREGIRRLVTVLRRYYPPGHRVVVYEASPYPICKSLIRRVALARLPKIDVPVSSTLFVPPRAPRS